MRVWKLAIQAIAVMLVWLPGLVAAQGAAGTALVGKVVNALSGEAIAGAVVVVEETRREVTAAADGGFRIEGLPAGRYHVSVRADGFSSRRTEVTVGAGASAPLTLEAEPELHFEEVTSVAATPRSQFDAFQPTSVLSGQELAKQLQASLGDTLQNEPGVAARSFGPTPSRPVIRGLDGDRVLILQDGQRVGDLSSQSGDHGVAVNPAAAQRIEVVRGPATLLYGANAIGGLVNVITDEIPTRPQHGATGSVTIDGGTAASEGGGAGDVHVGNGTVALHVGGGGRRSGDVATPLGDVANSQSRTGFGSVGLSWTGAKHYVGGSYGYDTMRYGIPVVEDGAVELTPRRHAFSVRAGGEGLAGTIDSYRATLAVRRYQHDELNAGAVDTHFTNDSTEGEVMLSHRAFGRLKGSIGGWGLDRAFGASGEEALSPDVGQRGGAGFVYEELTWPHVTFQFGGRVDRTRYTPAGETARQFTSGSGSVGLLFRPGALDDRLTFAVSLARAARNPALEELFFYGTHAGNFAFEVGNPELRPEHALGVDASVRWQTPRASGEVTLFRNDIADYVFRAPLTPEQFAAREPAFATRFPGRGIGTGGPEPEGDLPIVEYLAADSVLQGIEAHADVQLTSLFATEVGVDYVRGTLSATSEPLPRMPPLRVRAGLRFQRNALQAGGEAIFTATQDRIFPTETGTDGSQVVRLYSAYSFERGKVLHTVTVRLDNATNELYRSHLSLIKELVPEIGGNLKVLYSLKF